MEDENKGSSGFPIDRYVSDMKRQNTHSSSSMAPIEFAGCWISDVQDTLEFSSFLFTSPPPFAGSAESKAGPNVVLYYLIADSVRLSISRGDILLAYCVGTIH